MCTHWSIRVTPPGAHVMMGTQRESSKWPQYARHMLVICWAFVPHLWGICLIHQKLANKKYDFGREFEHIWTSKNLKKKIQDTLQVSSIGGSVTIP